MLEDNPTTSAVRRRYENLLREGVDIARERRNVLSSFTTALNRTSTGYHHSALPSDAKNYGSALSIYDQILGTFVYRPGQAPAELGVSTDSDLPDYDRTLAVMAMPFRRQGFPTHPSA